MAIDLEMLGRMGKRAVELASEQAQAQAQATLGLALALPPAPLSPDHEAATAAFTNALTKAPDRLTYAVDLAELVFSKTDSDTAVRELLDHVIAHPVVEGGRHELENRRARERARALLDGATHRNSDRWLEPVADPHETEVPRPAPAKDAG